MMPTPVVVHRSGVRPGMNYLEVLQWLAEQGFNTVMYPAQMVDHCATPIRFEPIPTEIEREREAPRDGRFFIEVARAKAGGVTAWIYLYPRPHGLLTNVSMAVDRPSALPSEMLVENLLHQPGCYRAPEVGRGLRVRRVNALADGYALSVELEKHSPTGRDPDR